MRLSSDQPVDPVVKEYLVAGQRLVALADEHSAAAGNCIRKMDDCVTAAKACFESGSDEEAERRFLEARVAGEEAATAYASVCEKVNGVLKELLAAMKEVREWRLRWRDRRAFRRQFGVINRHLMSCSRHVQRVDERMREFARWSVETDIRQNRPIRIAAA